MSHSSGGVLVVIRHVVIRVSDERKIQVPGAVGGEAEQPRRRGICAVGSFHHPVSSDLTRLR